MNAIFTTLLSSLKASIMPLWTKLKLWSSPVYWRTQGLTQIRKFFAKVFRIKPKDGSDYYGVFNWLVSKRLAFAIVLVLGVISVYYILIMSPLALSESGIGSSSVRAYKYNSIPLKFMEGTVRILAEGKYIAYEGHVKAGFAEGGGMLFNKDGILIYQGNFSKSKYNGQGKLYYPDQTLCYAGEFTDNVFNGFGTYNYPSGILEYAGGYVNGQRTGQGILYNAGGNQIFSGTFLMDEIVYGEFLGKTTSETSGMYTGMTKTFSGNGEYCVEMSEIGAVLTVLDGTNTLDEEWPVSRVTVVKNAVQLGGAMISEINGLTAYFGTPDYLGTTLLDLSDAVSINALNSMRIGQVKMTLAESFGHVYTVNDYDYDYEIYIYVYVHDGLVYTFFCPRGGTQDFLMYSIELA